MKIFISILLLLLNGIKLIAQPCGVAQSLNASQQNAIAAILNPLDTALKYENLHKIDSLNSQLKIAYGQQAGRPEAVETFYTLTTNTVWLNLNSSVSLSRSLIAADSLTYVNLWKMAKGRKPQGYLPNSIFLRSSAEIASGLLKFAFYETDQNRKSIYLIWAETALDSLMSMQIKTGPSSGAFPFPDLRMYNDPAFGPIIQNFMFKCGQDSVNVLQNGWIINDKGTGEFKFDAGVIANAFYEAYRYTGKVKYKNVVVSIGNYLKNLRFNVNYNYNTFSSLGLTRAYQLSGDITYLDRAVKNLRYSVYPGQLANGRWVDGHNASSRYQSIIILNGVCTTGELTSLNPQKIKIDSMMYLAVKNLTDYTNNCNSATGYRWLLKAYLPANDFLNQTLKDSLKILIGRFINQSALNGKYLDVPTLGEYLELLDLLSATKENSLINETEITVFPNPCRGNLNVKMAKSDKKITDVFLYNSFGLLVLHSSNPVFTNGCLQIQLDGMNAGVYYLKLQNTEATYCLKIIKSE